MDANNLLRKIYWVSEWNYLGFLVKNTYGMNTTSEGDMIYIKASRKMRNPFNRSIITERSKEEFDSYFIEQMDKLSKFFQFTYKIIESSAQSNIQRGSELLQEYQVTIQILSIGEDTKVSRNYMFYYEDDDGAFVKWAKKRLVEAREYICW